jgi:hypothetical protein
VQQKHNLEGLFQKAQFRWIISTKALFRGIVSTKAQFI